MMQAVIRDDVLSEAMEFAFSMAQKVHNSKKSDKCFMVVKMSSIIVLGPGTCFQSWQSYLDVYLLANTTTYSVFAEAKNLISCIAIKISYCSVTLNVARLQIKALFAAAVDGHMETVQKLLEAKADPNCHSPTEVCSAFYFSASRSSA
jgi:hypothetical protein